MTDSSADEQADEAWTMDDLIDGLAEIDGVCSLEDLSQAYAQLLAEQEQLSDSLPALANSDEPAASEFTEDVATTALERSAAFVDFRKVRSEALEPEDRVGITPARIVEAILFVGTPDNVPLTGRLLASLMRGVSPDEVDEHVDELNQGYEQEGSAYRITKQDLGYRMELSPTHASIRNRFYGQVREVRLPQGVIDILAVVAYHQPVTKPVVEKLVGVPCTGSLNQLLRRNLLQLTKESDGAKVFRTTGRFLELFDLESLEDLPHSEALED